MFSVLLTLFRPSRITMEIIEHSIVQIARLTMEASLRFHIYIHLFHDNPSAALFQADLPVGEYDFCIKTQKSAERADEDAFRGSWRIYSTFRRMSPPEVRASTGRSPRESGACTSPEREWQRKS